MQAQAGAEEPRQKATAVIQERRGDGPSKDKDHGNATDITKKAPQGLVPGLGVREKKRSHIMPMTLLWLAG